MTLTVSYLGPQGTFSEEAVVKLSSLLGCETRAVPYLAIDDCTEAVEEGNADYAVVPMENSLEGSVHATLDILTTSASLQICGELVLDIEHNLMSSTGTPDGITRVFSHPQAMAQCRVFLRRSLPKALTVPVLSTAEAASMVAKIGPTAAAIGSRRAAELYSLEIIAHSIQDNSGNQTRFVILGRQAKLGAPVKTSLLFAVKDGPGSLFRVLESFAKNEVNLTRIESRPAKRQLGDYLFFVDLAGTPDDARVVTALREAAREAVMLKLLGSYPLL